MSIDQADMVLRGINVYDTIVCVRGDALSIVHYGQRHFSILLTGFYSNYYIDNYTWNMIMISVN